MAEVHSYRSALKNNRVQAAHGLSAVYSRGSTERILLQAVSREQDVISPACFDGGMDLIDQVFKGKLMVDISKSAVNMFIVAVLCEVLEKDFQGVLKLSVKRILNALVVNPAQRLNIGPSMR